MKCRPALYVRAARRSARAVLRVSALRRPGYGQPSSTAHRHGTKRNFAAAREGGTESRRAGRTNCRTGHSSRAPRLDLTPSSPVHALVRVRSRTRRAFQRKRAAPKRLIAAAGVCLEGEEGTRSAQPAAQFSGCRAGGWPPASFESLAACAM